MAIARTLPKPDTGFSAVAAGCVASVVAALDGSALATAGARAAVAAGSGFAASAGVAGVSSVSGSLMAQIRSRGLHR